MDISVPLSARIGIRCLGPDDLQERLGRDDPHFTIDGDFQQMIIAADDIIRFSASF